MTRKILEEIRFYKKFHPFELFKDEIFGSGCGIEKEHLININLDVTSERLTYKDSFQWDIINEENMYNSSLLTLIIDQKILLSL